MVCCGCKQRIPKKLSDTPGWMAAPDSIPVLIQDEEQNMEEDELSYVNVAHQWKDLDDSVTVGPVFYLEALTEPVCQTVVIEGEECLQYKWMAMDLETREHVSYGVTDKLPQYGPALFQSYKDSERYWFGRRSREWGIRQMEFCKDIYQLKSLDEYDRLSKEFNI